MTKFLKQAIGRATDLLQDAGPFEEHSDYFLFGVLDLLYQMSFRIRKRARPACFVTFIKMVRLVLEQSQLLSPDVCLKATDLWNRLMLLSEKDHSMYGEEADRHAVGKLIKQCPVTSLDSYESSEMYASSSNTTN
jgi:hypothetical protein